jgi:hypothetical protein
MTMNDFRKPAYEVAEKNGPKQVFNNDLKIANGKKWYYNFMKRHPNLLRQT